MKNNGIDFVKIKDLRFVDSSGAFSIHAASGLIRVDQNFYLISDDERSLYKFSLDSNLGERIELQPGTLPENPIERKREKPDWEALLCLPTLYGGERILVIPSGSKSNRQTGFLVSTRESAEAYTKQMDFSPLYQKLQSSLSDINIEGAVITNATLKLFHRGNGIGNKNAIIDLDLASVLEDLQRSRTLNPKSILAINDFDLGDLAGVPLSFTDAFANGEDLFFLAVAEDTSSTYDDGEYRGAILGQINSQGKLTSNWDINCAEKPEGLWMQKSAHGYEVFFVTDPDSRTKTSAIYKGSID